MIKSMKIGLKIQFPKLHVPVLRWLKNHREIRSKTVKIALKMHLQKLHVQVLLCLKNHREIRPKSVKIALKMHLPKLHVPVLLSLKTHREIRSKMWNLHWKCTFQNCTSRSCNGLKTIAKCDQKRENCIENTPSKIARPGFGFFFYAKHPAASNC